jgi:thiamine pyrophosphate-dependent acetolactate synthase large subunit-like protein
MFAADGCEGEFAMAQVKVVTAVATALRAADCDVIFGLLGDANMLYISEFVEKFGGRLVNAAHESGVVAIADGYARITGSAAFASVTHGPGFTNCLTALTEAVRARTPLVLLTGTASSQRGSLQTIDVSALATDVGAGHELIAQPQAVAEVIAFARTRAMRERRPIVVDLPSDLLLLEVDTQHRVDLGSGSAQPGGCSQDSLEDAMGVVLSAERPIILAGRGARAPGARQALTELSALTGAPLVTTLLAKDLFDGHPLNLGVCGTIASSLATDVLQNADSLIAFGASLNRFTTAEAALVKGKRVVQCCLEAADIGGYVRPEVALVGDAAVVAAQMVQQLREVGLRPSAPWGRVADRIRDFDRRSDFLAGGHGLDPRDVAIALDAALPTQKTLVTDCGHFQFAPWKFLTAEPGYFFHTMSFGSVGLAMPFAVGAAIGRPEVLTVACVGDGGFMMSIEAFNTAVRSGARLLVVVFNNSGYSAEYHKLAMNGFDTGLSGIDWPDLAQLARALGGAAMTVTSLADLADLPNLMEHPGPCLVDVHVDPTVNMY